MGSADAARTFQFETQRAPDLSTRSCARGAGRVGILIPTWPAPPPFLRRLRVTGHRFYGTRRPPSDEADAGAILALCYALVISVSTPSLVAVPRRSVQGSSARLSRAKASVLWSMSPVNWEAARLNHMCACT
jgi:hypothetical protein